MSLERCHRHNLELRGSQEMGRIRMQHALSAALSNREED